MSADWIQWSYGTGSISMRQGGLAGPHSAEENPFDADEILVAEQFGRDAVIINRRTGHLRVVCGERGIRGTGARFDAIHAAHFIPQGPYEGHIIVAELQSSQRVAIVHRDTGEILWSNTDFPLALDAIYWDDEHIMVSDMHAGVNKVRLEDGAHVWQYLPPDTGHPFYLDTFEHRDCSYGGDLLIGYWGANQVVREIKTETQ